MKKGWCLRTYNLNKRGDNVSELKKELAAVLTRHDAENGSNTPDHILAEYLLGCLAVFDAATLAREAWYGCKKTPGQIERQRNKEKDEEKEDE